MPRSCCPVVGSLFSNSSKGRSVLERRFIQLTTAFQKAFHDARSKSDLAVCSNICFHPRRGTISKRGRLQSPSFHFFPRGRLARDRAAGAVNTEMARGDRE